MLRFMNEGHNVIRTANETDAEMATLVHLGSGTVSVVQIVRLTFLHALKWWV